MQEGVAGEEGTLHAFHHDVEIMEAIILGMDLYRAGDTLQEVGLDEISDTHKEPENVIGHHNVLTAIILDPNASGKTATPPSQD